MTRHYIETIHKSKNMLDNEIYNKTKHSDTSSEATINTEA